MDATTELNPVDLDAAEERHEQREKARIEAESEARGELAWMLNDPAGRKRLRRQLFEAGFDVGSDDVRTNFHPDHGTMSFHEGLRAEALRIVWPILRGVALGDIPAGNVSLLFNEGNA